MGPKNRKKFICVKCERKFLTENAAWTHISFEHPGNPDLSVEIQCCNCNQQFLNLSEHDQHVLEIHHEKQIEPEPTLCISDETPICKSKYKYYCSLCSRKFGSENALWTHAAFKHVDNCQDLSTQYYCDPCKLVFESLQEFNQHQEISLEPNNAESPADFDPRENGSKVPGQERDFSSEILLMSTILTNDLLEEHVGVLERKVEYLEEYMRNLMSNLLSIPEPSPSPDIVRPRMERRDSLEDHNYSCESPMLLEDPENQDVEEEDRRTELSMGIEFGETICEGSYLEVCREETVVDTPHQEEQEMDTDQVHQDIRLQIHHLDIPTLENLVNSDLQTFDLPFYDLPDSTVQDTLDESQAETKTRRKLSRSRALPTQDAEGGMETGRKRSQSRPTLASA